MGFRWYDRAGQWIAYDAQGRISGYGDRNEVRVQFTRNGAGQMATIRDHVDGVALTLTWSGTQVASVRDRAGREVRYRWTGSHLDEVTDVLGQLWRYGYDNNGQLTRITDPEARVWEITYAQSYRVGGSGAPAGVATSGKPPVTQ